MSDDFADAVSNLEDEVDQAVVRAKKWGKLTSKEVAQELRRIADQWEGEPD